MGSTALGKKIRSWWEDFTGQTSIKMQNKANMDLAKYQTQVNEDFYNKYSSPEAMMRQYSEAGLNPNLVYGSAGAGQSNVPSFQAPAYHAPLSGSQKFDKMLSTVSGLMGLVQGVYQTQAAKEAAQQSAIKTAGDVFDVQNKKLNHDINLFTMGLEGPLNPYYLGHSNKFMEKKGFFNTPNFEYLLSKNQDTPLASYFHAVRSNAINKLLVPGLSNAADYGLYYDDHFGHPQKTNIFGTPNLYIRNQSNAMKYQLMHDLGNKGVYGKLAVSLLNAIL